MSLVNLPKRVFIKDPEADLDFSLNWRASEADGGPWLQVGEEIVTSTWEVFPPSGLTDHDPSITDGEITTIWLADGLLTQKQYKITNTITTDSTPARTDQRSIYINIIER